MSSTRDFKNPGIFADSATTVIPPTPIAGVAYRDAVTGTDDTPNGWRYGTRVESQDWNQVMFLLTSMMGMIDSQGMLGWSDLVDYAVPAVVFGSDGNHYKAIQPSGPATSVQDPTTAPLYWKIVPMGDIPDFLAAPSGRMKFENGIILQWTSILSGTAAPGSTAFNWPSPFPNNFFRCVGLEVGTFAASVSTVKVFSPGLIGANVTHVFALGSENPTVHVFAIGN